MAKRKYTKSGLTALKRKVQVAGMEAVDRRYGAARRLAAMRLSHEEALGGAAAMSPMQHVVLDTLLMERLIWSAYGRFLYQHRSQLVTGKRRIPYEYVQQFLKIGAQVVQHEAVLVGLEQPAAPTPVLADYLRERYGTPKRVRKPRVRRTDAPKKAPRVVATNGGPADADAPATMPPEAPAADSAPPGATITP